MEPKLYQGLVNIRRLSNGVEMANSSTHSIVKLRSIEVSFWEVLGDKQN